MKSRKPNLHKALWLSIFFMIFMFYCTFGRIYCTFPAFFLPVLASNPHTAWRFM